MLAQLAREVGNDDRRLQLLDGVEDSLPEMKQHNTFRPEVEKVGMAIIELMRSGDASEKRLGRIDELLGKVEENTRSAYSYFVGMELDKLGKTEVADLYLRRSLITPAYDPIYATLAGKALAGRHGTSRPNDDALDDGDLWPQPEAQSP